MSGKRLRVLLVEDSEDDALLLLRELEKGGYEPDYQRVQTPEAMEEALGEGPWEVVLSDYYMPRFGALAALEVLRGLGYDTPFVVVSGKIGEDAAVEVMRAGAQDYVTKEDMGRLCPAIERELREVEERRRAEEALHFLSEASAELSSSLDYRSTLAGVARLTVPRLADWCAVDVLEEDGSVHRLAVEHQDPEKVAWAHELQERYPPDEDQPQGLYEVLRSGHSELYPEIPDQMLVAAARDPEHLRIMRDLGFTSAMIVPLVARGRTLGAITLVSAESGRRYGRADLELAEELASRAALAVDNARLYDAAQREISERKRAETRYRTLVEQIPAVTYIQEPLESGTPKAVTYMSPQYETMFGYPAESEVVDEEHWLRTLHPGDRERVLAEEARTDETGKPFGIEYRMFARDGRVVWVRDEAVLVRDEQGSPLYWLGVQYDITERKRFEEALKASEELYRTVVEQAAENIFLVDVGSRCILEANAALVRSLGYTAEELKGMTLYDIVAHDRESIDFNVGRIVAQKSRFIGERRYRRKDGTLVDVEVSVSAVSYRGREVMCIVAHDITERKLSEMRLAEAREAERNRIARDLHDAVLQDIVYALQEIQVAQITSEDGVPAGLDEAADALRRSVEGLRGAIFELRLKEELGRSFVSSLEVLLDLNRRMARRTYGLDLVVDDGFPRTLPEGSGREIVRIVQEALANARCHAEPSRVEVRLGLDGDLARVEVSDDGRGFDVGRPGVGLGQQSMRHRARELGGELEVESAPGRGTRVRFEVPVSRLVAGEVREPLPEGRGPARPGDEGAPTA